MNWTRKVNKNGCPACCKQNSFGPNDIYNALGPNEFDISMRETVMAYKIIKGLALSQEHKEAIGFFGSDHLLELARNIGRFIEIDQEIFEKHENFNGGMIGFYKSLY